jgi:TrmH family RNA methyltransferase
MISSSNSKLIRSLRQKKFRDQLRLYLVEGEKMVLELMEGSGSGGSAIYRLFATGDWIGGHRESIRRSGVDATEATSVELRKVSNLVTPQRVMALVRIPETEISLKELASSLVLGFESVRDPGNLGTIIRTADWFGIGHILCTPDSVDLYNPKVVQATMGSMARVSIGYMDLEQLLRETPMQGKPVYGTFPAGENIYEASLERHPLILFGNESRGLSSRYDPFIRIRLSIPSFAGMQAGSESLNLASSVAVVCSEIRRRASS